MSAQLGGRSLSSHLADFTNWRSFKLGMKLSKSSPLSARSLTTVRIHFMASKAHTMNRKQFVAIRIHHNTNALSNRPHIIVSYRITPPIPKALSRPLPKFTFQAHITVHPQQQQAAMQPAQHPNAASSV